MTEAQFPYAIKLTVDTSDADAPIATLDQLLEGIQAKADSIDFTAMGTGIRNLSEGSQGLSTVSESLVSIAGALEKMATAAPGITSIAGSLEAIKTNAGPAATGSMAAFTKIGGAADTAAERVASLEAAITSAIARAQGLGGVGAVAPAGVYQPTSAEIVQAAGYTVGRRTAGQVYGTGALGPITGSANIEDIAGRLRQWQGGELRSPVDYTALPAARRGQHPPGAEEFWPLIPQPVQSFLSGYTTLPSYDPVGGRYSRISRRIGVPEAGAVPSSMAHETGHAAVDMVTRMAAWPGAPGYEQAGADLQTMFSSAGRIMRASSVDPSIASYVAEKRAWYPEGPHLQAEEMIADILGSGLTGVASRPAGELGALISQLPLDPIKRTLGHIRGLAPVDIAMLAGTQPQNAWDMMRYSRGGGPAWEGMPEMQMFGGMGPTISQGTQGHWSLQRPVGQWGPAYSTPQQAVAGYQRTYGMQQPPWAGYTSAPYSPPLQVPPPWPGTTAQPPPQQPYQFLPAPMPSPPPSPGVTGVQPPWPHGFARVTQERYQEAWGQAGQELKAIQQAYPGMVKAGPDMARVMSFEPARRGEPRDIGTVGGPAAQAQRTQQILASTGAMNDFGRSIARTAGYFLRWLIVWNVFEFVMNGLRSMVTEAAALEDIIARVAFIQGVPSGQAREYILDQYGAGAQYGMMPSQTREALPMAAAYGIDVGAGGQMRRAFGIEPSAGIEGLQQALYQTGAQTAEIQDTMAILYREAPNQAGQLLDVISKAGLLSRQLGASWEEIAFASVMTSRQMGVAPTEMTTAMARFAMRVPESMSPQIIQELAQMDDPSMIRRMGPSGLGIVTQRGGTQAQIMVEMIRNLNRAMEEGIEPGEAFADLLQSIADTPTEAFAEAKAGVAVAWTEAIAAADESVGFTSFFTEFFQGWAQWFRGETARPPTGGIIAYHQWKYGPQISALEAVGKTPKGGRPALEELKPGIGGSPYWRPEPPSVIQDYFGQLEGPQPMTHLVTPQWQIDMTQDPLKYIGGMRQYGDLSQEEFTGRLGERMPEFERMLEQIVQMTPGTDEQRATMRTRITEGFATGGGIFGFQGGEVGALTGKQEAMAKWVQSVYPEELRETPFKTLGDVTEAEFMRMLPRAQEWEREAEDIFGREFEEVRMDIAFEDSFKELTMSQEALTKTMELLNDTMTGMWNIPAGQMPMIPMPRGIDIVTGDSDGTVGDQIAAYTTATSDEITAMGTLTDALMRLAGVMESGTIGAQIGRYVSLGYGPPPGHPQAGSSPPGYPPQGHPQAPTGPPPGHPQAPTGYPPPGHPQAPINMTAYLTIDGQQIVTQVERAMIQDARVTGRSI